MLGSSLQFSRVNGDNTFNNPAKARRQVQFQYEIPPRAKENHLPENCLPEKHLPKNHFPENRFPENKLMENRTVFEDCIRPVPSSLAFRSGCGNLDRFLESTTPYVRAQFVSKAVMRGWRTSNIEFQPYFSLGDLWESFKEWSAYGAGVPLVLNGTDGVVQYYVPYLSGIQIYAESAKNPVTSRKPGEESDGDSYKDTSSEGSDFEVERGLKYAKEQWNLHNSSGVSTLTMERSSMREKNMKPHPQEGSSSDAGEVCNSNGSLLFEFFEQDPPYSREPLAGKVFDLANRFPQLQTLRSCDLLSSSWLSVAWYPIYRIPMGPTLHDLETSFLTFHCLSTPSRDSSSTQCAVCSSSQKTPKGSPKLPLPIFGLASYKLKGTAWSPSSVLERQQAQSLLQAAKIWLKELKVDLHDFQFFVSHVTNRR
ncbi:hypothetical protein AMTRI_Chr13g85230 [Amborella trichopoda]